MTLDQKIQQIGNLPEPNDIAGTYLAEGGGQSTCQFSALGRHISGIPELAIPTMREVNQGVGIRGGDCAKEPIKTGGPSEPMSAASFDPQAVKAWGEVLGSEAKTFAHPVLLGPAMNLIRDPFEGRAQEYPSEDPYLAGRMGTAKVEGIQAAGTQAMMKHFVGNEHEFRYERWTAAVRIPSRAMHELYLLPFEMAAKDGHAAALMCAYPMVNYKWNCDSSPSLQQTVRDRWGWKGWIESDRNAMHSTVNAMEAGVGWELDWTPKFYSADAIKENIAAGQIREAQIDEVLRPRYIQMFTFGNFDHPENAFGVDDLAANDAVQRKVAEEGITLLKNEKNMLPLNTHLSAVKSIALIGPQWFAGEATLPPRGNKPDANTYVAAPHTVTPLQGIQHELSRLGSTATVTFNNGTDTASAVALAKRSDLVIMMLGTNPREMWDLTKTNLPVVQDVNQHDLVWAVSKANPNNVVVLKTGAGVTMNWSHRTRAIVAAWFPGQDDGDVVAGVLFGRINPSGKSPVTWPATSKEAAWSTTRQYPGVHEDTGVNGGTSRNPAPGQKQLVAYYDEDLSMGYRWYEQNHVTPTYAFGHGLSYTTFAYGNLRVQPLTNPRTGRTVLVVRYRVTNTGKVAGKEASQVYLTLPAKANEPSKRLVGFSKDLIQPGQSKNVRVVIDSAAANHPLSYFQPASTDLDKWADGDWHQARGRYTVHVGGASDQTPLNQSVTLTP